MASRTMHLAVTENIIRNVDIKDKERFKFGCILPDAYSGSSMNKDASHYKEIICDGKMKTYNIDKFRNQFVDKILIDNMYLGYYIHLIQDLVFRQFLYVEHNWNSKILGNVEKLHDDYKCLNSYLIEKYMLNNDIVIPENFDKEEINKIYSFDIENMLRETKEDFGKNIKGKISFLTKEMADEYVNKASKTCITELGYVANGIFGVSAIDFAWRISMKNENCPCKRVKCERHGDCDACREHHNTVKKSVIPACDRINIDSKQVM